MVFSHNDQVRFGSVDDLVRDVQLHGYYGGIRLVRATIKKFVDYCRRRAIVLRKENFSVRYQTNIPRLVGLAGSSAIIVATLRCLMEFYDVSIPLEVQPSLVLSVEAEELGIAAGLQDRVVQVYEGLVYMDFAKDRMHESDGYQCGVYERLDPAMLPPLYVAFNPNVASPHRTHARRPSRQVQRRRTGCRRSHAEVRQPNGPGERRTAARPARGTCPPGRRKFRPAAVYLRAACRTGGNGRTGPSSWGQRKICRFGRRQRRHICR